MFWVILFGIITVQPILKPEKQLPKYELPPVYLVYQTETTDWQEVPCEWVVVTSKPDGEVSILFELPEDVWSTPNMWYGQVVELFILSSNSISRLRFEVKSTVFRGVRKREVMGVRVNKFVARPAT
jgi:hypothetical protein